MKTLIPPKKSLFTYLKTAPLVGDLYKALFFFSFGYFLSSHFSFMKLLLPLTIIITLVIVTHWFLSQYLYRKPVSLDETTLSIRGEPFNLDQIEYLTYNQKPLPTDDYLKIKVRGHEERHICIYEKFYREDLRLYKFLKNNIIEVELKKGA